MFQAPTIAEIERSHGVRWGDLVELEPELNQLLWRARRVGSAVRTRSDVPEAFAPLRSEITRLVGFSSKNERHPVLGMVGAYDVTYWKVYHAVSGLLPRLDDARCPSNVMPSSTCATEGTTSSSSRFALGGILLNLLRRLAARQPIADQLS